MQTFKVLGGGCNNCKITFNLITEIADELGKTIQIEKVEDIQDIMAYDVMSTPGVVIDENVVHRGGIPTRKQVVEWMVKV